MVDDRNQEVHFQKGISLADGIKGISLADGIKGISGGRYTFLREAADAYEQHRETFFATPRAVQRLVALTNAKVQAGTMVQPSNVKVKSKLNAHTSKPRPQILNPKVKSKLPMLARADTNAPHPYPIDVFCDGCNRNPQQPTLNPKP